MILELGYKGGLRLMLITKKEGTFPLVCSLDMAYEHMLDLNFAS